MREAMQSPAARGWALGAGSWVQGAGGVGPACAPWPWARDAMGLSGGVGHARCVVRLACSAVRCSTVRCDAVER